MSDCVEQEVVWLLMERGLTLAIASLRGRTRGRPVTVARD